MLPPSSCVIDGSLKPVLISGLVKNIVLFQFTGVQLRPPSLEVQMPTWLR